MRSRRIRTLVGVMTAAGLVGLATLAAAQPSADQVLANVGLSADDKQRVLKGEFVTADAKAVSAQGLEKYLPTFHAALLDYPKGMAPEMQENFLWQKSIVDGKPTYALQHTLVVAEGAARAMAQRQYYVSAS